MEHWAVSDKIRQLLFLLYTVTLIAGDDSESSGSMTFGIECRMN